MPALAVVEDLEVLEDGVGQLDAGLPSAAVEQPDLHPARERFDDGVIERVADQQILLDNLIAFLKTNKDSEYIAKVLLSLEDLQEAFDELYFNDEETIITKKQYVNIVNKVREIRTEFID